jgi:hypothetical protein
MRDVTATPTTVPWQENCTKCALLAADPEPGLSSWRLAVGMHFQADHHINLRNPS